VWSDTLGVRLALDRTFPDRNTRILFFRLRDITIEISGGAEQPEEGVGKPDRIWGLAWGVDSVDAACSRLRDAGIDVSGPRRGIKPGTLVATVKGQHTHGVATLLIEHTAESFQPEARAAHSGAFDNAPQHRAFTATALHHATVSTPDLDGTLAKWTGTLGLRAGQVGAPDGRGMRLAALSAGNSFVEVVQPTTADSDLAQAMSQRGQGMLSITIEVDDLIGAIADLRAKGVAVSDPEPGVWTGTRVAYIPRGAANGVPIELLERE
jgi:methylmalonyl-CoA/ethylmalonyl-CoA epimerase